MKYQPIVDLYKVPAPLLKYLQRGQWVTAGGGNDARGVWCGRKPSGLHVVCWYKGGQSFASRRKALMSFAAKG
jgi:hypothetical protein